MDCADTHGGSAKGAEAETGTVTSSSKEIYMFKYPLNSSLKWEEILKTMADGTRLYIIHELIKNEMSVNELAKILGLKVYNVSRHLKILESSGLIEKRKEGTSRIYKITDDLRSRYSQEKEVLDLGCCKFEFKYLKD